MSCRDNSRALVRGFCTHTKKQKLTTSLTALASSFAFGSGSFAGGGAWLAARIGQYLYFYISKVSKLIFLFTWVFAAADLLSLPALQGTRRSSFGSNGAETLAAAGAAATGLRESRYDGAPAGAAPGRVLEP